MLKRVPLPRVSAPILLLSVFACSCHVIRDPIQPPSTADSGRNLVSSDAFNTPDGSAPDAKKWTSDLGGKGWGNRELECYTNRLQNAHIPGGNLVIAAQ